MFYQIVMSSWVLWVKSSLLNKQTNFSLSSYNFRHQRKYCDNRVERESNILSRCSANILYFSLCRGLYRISVIFKLHHDFSHQATSQFRLTRPDTNSKLQSYGLLCTVLTPNQWWVTTHINTILYRFQSWVVALVKRLIAFNHNNNKCLFPCLMQKNYTPSLLGGELYILLTALNCS